MIVFCFYEATFLKDIKQYTKDLEKLLDLNEIELHISEPTNNPIIIEHTNLKVFINGFNNYFIEDNIKNSIIIEFFKDRQFEYMEQKMNDRLIFKYLN